MKQDLIKSAKKLVFNAKSALFTGFTYIKKLTAPLWKPVYDFLFKYLNPYYQKFWIPVVKKYKTWTEPIRVWHRKLKTKSPFLGKVIQWSYDLGRYGLYLLFTLFFFSWIGIFGHMPSRKELKNIQNATTTEIYTADSVLIGRFYVEDRTEIALENISPYVITALLAVEDKRFFEHSGVDLRSWMRVFKGIATNTKGLGGGSTLSQQLAKNLYPRRNYWIPGSSLLINKIRENIISIKLERIYNKEELLSLYLNTVPFGGDRYGIHVGSKYFYNKKAKDLNAAEAATLIGMLKATTALDPVRNPENSKKRRNLVLSKMVENSNFVFNDVELSTVTRHIKNGKFSQEDFNKIKDKPVGARKYATDEHIQGKAAYFKEYLRTRAMPEILKNLRKKDGSNYNLYRDGLKIYTTLDSRMQEYAEEAVGKQLNVLQERFDEHWKDFDGDKPWKNDKWLKEQITRSERYLRMKDESIPDSTIARTFKIPVNMTVFSWKNGGQEVDTLMTPLDSIMHYFLTLNSGFLAMDHTNGQIKSWVGGINFKYFQYDHILTRRQVGSTFKPIVYGAALQDSVKPCDYFKNEIRTIDDWTPNNSDGVYGGYVSMNGGLAYSINTIAAQLIERVGIQKTMDLARKMGVTSPMPFEWGISLGSADISLFEMVKVFGTIANKGLRPDPIAVLSVKDKDGNTIYDHEEESRRSLSREADARALTEDEAAILTKMLRSVIDQGTARGFRYAHLGPGGYEFAGKTGTSQNQSDGWFIAFNPQIVTGAWVGGPSPSVRFRWMSLGQGSATALPIVGEFWRSILNDRKHRVLGTLKFEENPNIAGMFNCPSKLPFSPQMLQQLMQDPQIRDSIIANGYRDLEELIKSIDEPWIGESEEFSEEIPVTDVPEEGERRTFGESGRTVDEILSDWAKRRAEKQKLEEGETLPEEVPEEEAVEDENIE